MKPESAENDVNTDAGRNALLELCEKATPGPWQSRETPGYELFSHGYRFPVLFEVSDNASTVAAITKYGKQAKHNAAFIAAARTALPAAIAKIAELERELAEAAKRSVQVIQTNGQLLGQRNALQQEVAALRADGERLDWLESQVDRDKQALNNGCFQQTIQVFGNRTLRQAIDSARAAAGEEGKS